MSLVVTLVIAFALVDGPWRWVVIAGGLLWEAFEIALFLKWRGVRSMTGHETLVGMKGRTVTECRPEGQAQIKGQLWKVRCPEGVPVGAQVIVTAADGLLLMVEPAELAATSKREPLR